MKKLAAFLFALSFLASSSTLTAAEHWDYFSSADLPVSNNVYSATHFKGKLYVHTDQGLFRSSDAKSWEKIDNQSLSAAIFIAHNGALYNIERKYSPNKSINVWRSEDGVAWAAIKTFDFPNLADFYLTEAYSDGTHLYFVNMDGTVQRTTGEGNPLVWEGLGDIVSSVPRTLLVNSAGQNLSRKQIKTAFVGQNGNVYAFSIFVNDTPTLSTTHGEIYWLKPNGTSERIVVANAGISYTQVGEINLFEHNEWLYLNHPTGVWRAKINELANWDLFVSADVNGQRRTVANLFGVLHLFSFADPVKILNSQEQWESAASSKIGPIDLTVQAESGAYVFPFVPGTLQVESVVKEMWYLAKGAVDVRSQPLPPGTSLHSGQRKGTVLGMKINANLGDSMRLTVKNIGTARQGESIEALYLLKSPEGNPGTAASVSAAFTPDTADPKTWVLSTPFPVADGDEIYVVADISANATVGDTFIAVVDAVTFQDNTSFVLNAPIGSVQALAITHAPAAAGLGAIDGVIVYPKPSKDIVRFLYDLQTDAEVLVRIFDLEGTLVSEVSDSKTAGNQISSQWDATQMGPGIYYAVIKIKPASGSERVYKERVYIER